MTRSTDTRTLLPRVPCECTTAECKECPERADSAASRYSAYLLYWYKSTHTDAETLLLLLLAAGRRARARTLLPRAPCECTTAECKECPERTDAVRARRNAQVCRWSQ